MSVLKKFIITSRYDKPHGILLLFLPCVWGISFNDHNITEEIFLCIIFFIGASGMRALGCIWNDYNDKNFDIKVSRTKDRLIANKKVTKKQIISFAVINGLIGSTPLFFLPYDTIILAFCVIPLVVSYPFMKRITWWPQFWLGLNFNWGILVGYSILEESLINIDIIFFYLGAVFFTIGYDTIYGYQDVEDDILIGIKSTSLKFNKTPKIFLVFIYICCFLLWFVSLILFEMSVNLIILFFLLCTFLLFKVLKTNYKNTESCNKTFIYNSYFSCIIALILLSLN